MTVRASLSVTANLVCTFSLSVSQRGCIPWCNNEEKRLILPSCCLCFPLLSLHSPPTSLQSKSQHSGQLQFHFTNNTNPNKPHTTPQKWAPSHLAYFNPLPCDQHGHLANGIQFNSLVSAITSCFMAIVNGIVTICKAIINVRQHRASTDLRIIQTTNTHLNRALSPSSPFSPTASPAARLAAVGRQPALSKGTFDRLPRQGSHLTERKPYDWQAGSAQTTKSFFATRLSNTTRASILVFSTWEG